MDKIELNKVENLKSGFKKAGIHLVNREKLIERLAEHKSSLLDDDLIGKAFLDQIQNEHQDFIGLDGKPRKKNCKCYRAIVYQLMIGKNHEKPRDLQL